MTYLTILFRIIKSQLLVSSILISTNSFAQIIQNKILVGKIVDEKQQSIPFVNIFLHNNPIKGTQTNVNGEFVMTCIETDADLIISHLNYISDTLRLKDLVIGNSSNDTLYAIIYLYEKLNVLDEVSISAKYELIRVLNTQIIDYNFFQGELIYAEAYDGMEFFTRNHIKYSLPFLNTRAILKDLFGELHFVTKDSVYQLSFNMLNNFHQGISKDSFNKNLFLFKVSTKNSLIFIKDSEFDRNYFGQLNIIFKFHKSNKKLEPLLFLIDKENLNKIVNDSLELIQTYNRNAMPKHNKIIQKTWNGKISGLDLYDLDFLMLQQWYLKHTIVHQKNDLFDYGNAFYLVSYFNDSIYKYNYNDSLINKAYYPFSKTNISRQSVLFDCTLKCSFITNTKNGYLSISKIDLESGQTFAETKITHRFPKNIKVDNGFVYYIIAGDGLLSDDILYKLKIE